MNNILNDVVAIKKLDSKNMLGSIELFPQQIEEVWSLGKLFKFPASHKNITRVVVMGMGGSALGAHILKSVYFGELPVPIEIVNHYHVPGYVDKNTLVICSSYSGTTEEILSASKESAAKKAKVIVITSGDKLAEWAKNNKIPAFIFSTKNNPCGSPRMGLGYSVFGLLVILNKLGLTNVSDVEIKKIIVQVKNNIKQFGANAVDNAAKKIAQSVFDRSVWYIGSEHLAGSAHAAGNQMNENAKRFSGYFIAPELNHHLMEGMVHPDANQSDLIFVLLDSKLYDKRVQKRYAITRDILTKNKIQFVDYHLTGKTPIAQAAECLVLSSCVSFYSAMLQGIDPTAIPFVDYFKAQLANK